MMQPLVLVKVEPQHSFDEHRFSLRKGRGEGEG